MKRLAGLFLVGMAGLALTVFSGGAHGGARHVIQDLHLIHRFRVPSSAVWSSTPAIFVSLAERTYRAACGSTRAGY